MIYLNAFIFCGIVCAIGQIILDNTKLTAGHITTIFVVVDTLPLVPEDTNINKIYCTNR